MATGVQTKKYTCPKCGKKHAADLSALEGHPEIHGKVHCMKCHELLWLSLADDGMPVVELYKDHLRKAETGAAPAPKTTAKAETPEKASSLPSMLVAALVAAIVSFLVGQATGSSAAEVEGTASVSEVSAPSVEQLTALQTDVQSLRADTSAVAMAQTKLEAELRGAAKTQGESVDAIGVSLAESKLALTTLQERIGKIEKLYDTLHGRIEMNYTNLRQAKKALDALKGE